MFLESFKESVEAEAVDSFWESRKKGILNKKPEKLGQELLGFFGSAKLKERGAVIREAKSGIGFVDVLVTFSSGLLHVVELKILKGKATPGPSQLAVYMKQKKRDEGWLVLFDTRKSTTKTKVAVSIKKPAGTVRTIVIDINPVPPHKLVA
jgi:hypothetical protein